MEKIKLEKGITLIALIITIVVLLILAVVAISVVQESNIIGSAKNAVEKHEAGKADEESKLAEYETFLESNLPGKNEEDEEEIVISEEKDIGAISYLYATQYNPNQPEIISASGYNSDENKDGMHDDDPSQPANIDDTYFNIKNTFFEQDMPTEGNIEAKITHLDGTVEDIILTKKEDSVAWEYEAESPLDNIDKLYIGFRPNAKYKDVSKADSIDRYEGSADYHYMYVEGELIVPFQKLEMLGKTLEFPVVSAVGLGIMNMNLSEIYSMYKDINNVNKITLNFSDDTKKVYLKEQFETELTFFEGAIISLLSVSGLQLPITSVIIEEDGIETKYNVTDSTIVFHGRGGS